MLFNFFRPFRDSLSQKVKSHQRIAANYIRGWFFIDCLSTIPFDVIAMLFDDADGGSSITLKIIRLMRLLKLFRIVRASRLVARWADRIEHYISISHSTRTLLWWMFIILATIHWFCCSWGLAAQLHGSQRTDALRAAVALDEDCAAIACLPTDPLAAPQCSNPCLLDCELKLLMELRGWNADIAFKNENWVCRGISSGHFPSSGWESHFYRYSYVASGSSTNIVGQISPQNIVEYCVGYIFAFCWMMMMNSFIGILCGTIADGDRHAKEYKQRMDELNYFLRDMQAPRELAVRAREHCRSTRGLFKKKEYQKLFHIMSPMLRGDLAQQMSLRTLENVWYFTSC